MRHSKRTDEVEKSHELGHEVHGHVATVAAGVVVEVRSGAAGGSVDERFEEAAFVRLPHPPRRVEHQGLYYHSPGLAINLTISNTQQELIEWLSRRFNDIENNREFTIKIWEVDMYLEDEEVSYPLVVRDDVVSIVGRFAGADERGCLVVTLECTEPKDIRDGEWHHKVSFSVALYLGLWIGRLSNPLGGCYIYTLEPCFS